MTLFVTTFQTLMHKAKCARHLALESHLKNFKNFYGKISLSNSTTSQAKREIVKQLVNQHLINQQRYLR